GRPMSLHGADARFAAGVLDAGAGGDPVGRGRGGAQGRGGGARGGGGVAGGFEGVGAGCGGADGADLDGAARRSQGCASAMTSAAIFSTSPATSPSLSHST